MEDFEDWWANIDAPVGRPRNRFEVSAPPAQPAPVASPSLPSTRPTNVAGQYTDLNQILLGNDLRNQLFSQFGLGDYGWSEKAAGESGDYALGTLTPEAQDALQGYSFNWDPTGVRNQGTLTVFDPQGQQAGQYQQTDRSTLDDVREYVGLGLQAASFFAPGLLPGLFQGLGTVGSGAVMGGLSSLVQGQDPLRGAVLGGLGSFTSPYIGQAASAASEAVGGGSLGSAVSGAVTGAGRTALTGGDLLTGALAGAATPISSAIVGALDLPESIGNIATRGLSAEILGKDAEKAIINAALGELFRPDPNEAALRAAYGPEGQASRVAEGEFRAGQERTAFDDLLASLAPTSAPLPQTSTADLDAMIEDPYGPRPAGMSPMEREAFLEANIPDPLERLLARPAEEVDWASVYAQPSMAPAYTDPDGFYVHEAPLIGADPATYPIQGIVPTPENMASYQANLQDIYDNRGGFTSQWQTAGSDRIMIQDDGSAIGINTETGETYGLEADETQRLVDAGLLNTEASGYADAIGASPPAAAPPPAPPPTTAAPVPAPAPSTTPAGGLNLGVLMAMLGGMGAGQGGKRDEYKTADVSGAQSPFGSLLDILRG